MTNRYSAIRSSSLRTLSIGCATITLTAAAVVADGPPPPAQIVWQAEDENPVTIFAEGTYIDEDLVSYIGEAAAESGDWEVTWNLTANLDFASEVSINGDITVLNNRSTSSSYLFSVSVPVCTDTPIQTLIGGLTVVSLDMNEGGGMISCGPDGPVWQAMIDGQPAYALFTCPFEMGSTGEGSASTNSFFGSPFPSQEGPPLTASFGLQVGFDLTGGEEVELNSLLVIAPENPDGFPGCSTNENADINGDGTVNSADLGQLLGLWGSGNPLGDLNSDGTVDGLDLSALLGAWSA